MGIINTIKSCLNYKQWTISSPFRWAKHPKNDIRASSKTVVVGITYARLHHDKRLRRLFLNHVKRVNTSLAEQQGFIGSSLRSQPFGDEAWTVSVWENKHDMQQFVYSEPHLSAMKEASKTMAAAKTTHIELDATDLPLKWRKILTILHEKCN
ncbi:MAG TPA: DUF3291 domain-containing protein [Thiothrix sp.]|nr:DUF3291 domain-containing protein [Thiothrix sp.]